MTTRLLELRERQELWEDAKAAGELTGELEQAGLHSRMLAVNLSGRVGRLLRLVDDRDLSPSEGTEVALRGFATATELDAVNDHVDDITEALAERLQIVRAAAAEYAEEELYLQTVAQGDLCGATGADMPAA